MKFKEGDRVIYVSGEYGDGESNPLKGTKFECGGYVREIKYNSVYVNWDNGSSNTYKFNDLILEKRKIKKHKLTNLFS